jgi:hypothetical protein
MNKIIKYILWVIAVILIITILNFIFLTVKTRNYRYDVTLIHNPKISNLFKDSLQASLIFNAAFGNENEQIYIYDYKQSFNLIVWNLAGFSKVNPSEIELVTNSNFSLIKFNPQTYIDWGNPKVRMSVKHELFDVTNLIIHVNEGFTLNNSIKKNEILFLDMISNGLVVSDNEIDYKLKFEFDSPMHCNVVFTNQISSFQIILLKPIGNNKIGEFELIDLLKIPG